MKLYPWLEKTYNHIITQHQNQQAHHAILIKTQKGIGASLLVWFISKWLLCLQKTGINFCDKCHGCKLMSFHNHPDWHDLIKDNNDVLNVDNIRSINEKIFQYSQQGGAKIIFVSNTAKFTESAVNAFLKTLEEPPENTWFFFINYADLNLHPTLNSRCLVQKLFIPSEKNSINWLKNEITKQNKSYLTALRVNQGSPITAKKFINSGMWEDRINFYKYLLYAFQKKNLLKILPVLKEKNSIIKIDWICLLLLDSIKFNFNQVNNLINCDQIELIKLFAQKYDNFILDTSMRTWMHCRYRLLNISGINNELLLLEQLLIWEKNLNFINIT